MPSVEPSPREAVGTLLRNNRLAHGLDIAQVADALRIRLSFIQAIEEGRHQDLPGPTYAVGFVRAYADYMGLDGNEIVRRYKEETSIVPRKAELEFPTPVSEGGLPTGAMILIAALLGAGIYGGWYWMSNDDRSVAALIQDVPERFNSLLTAEPDTAPTAGTDGGAAAPAETAVAEVAPVAPQIVEALPEPAAPAPAPAGAPEPATATAPDAEPAAEPANAEPEPPAPLEEAAVPPAEEEEPEPAPEEEAAAPAAPAAPEEPAQAEGAAEPEAEPEPEPAPAAAEPAAEQEVAVVPAAPDLPETTAPASGTVYGAPAGSTRVVLAAKEDTWIQVRAGEELVFTRLLRQGERFQVPERNDLTLMVGNAGGLQIQVDGRPLPALGGPGDVRRGIELDPERLVAN